MESSFDDIQLFVQLVRAGSLAALAEQQGIPAATVSRRLKKLEQALGVTLVYRSARRFQLSSAGEAYYQAFAARSDDWGATLQQLQQQTHELSGPLTVSAPSTLSIGLLRPIWRRFVQQHADIELTMLLSDQTVDLQAQQVDLAIRIGPQPDSGLTQQRLGQVRTGLFIGTGLAQQLQQQQALPQLPQQLNRQRLVVFERLPVWQLSDGQQQLEIHPRASTRVTNIRMALDLVVHNLGISLLPYSEVGEALARGEVVPLLPEWRGPLRDIYAVWPDGRLLSARARCLRDYLRQQMAGIAELQGELRGPRLTGDATD